MPHLAPVVVHHHLNTLIRPTIQGGHTVKALVRNPGKLALKTPNLELHQGSIGHYDKMADLVKKNTLTRYGGLLGQHRDNQAVLKYLVEEASDIEWIVHRASIISNGPSKGILKRSKSNFSLATFGDCAAYNYHTLSDESAIHTDDLSYYPK